jgi:L-rhamnose isomerase
LSILAQHDRLAIEAVDPHVLQDLTAYLKHGSLTAARAEKRKQFDRAIDHPIDGVRITPVRLAFQRLVIDLGLEIFGRAFMDRAMQRA